MKRITYLLLVAMSLSANTAAADECFRYFRSVYDFNDPTSPLAQTNNSPRRVQGIRLYHDGNISLAMSENYDPQTQAFNHNERDLGFVITRHDENNIRNDQTYLVSGQFRDVFPGKDTADLVTLTILRNGEAKITLNDEGNQEFALEELDCRGQGTNFFSDYFLMEGKVHVPPYTSTWKFTVKRGL